MSSNPSKPEVRKGTPDVKLSRKEFQKRFTARFYDPAFDQAKAEIQKLSDIAWEAYDQYRKSPRHQLAGKEFANPDYELPIEWLETRKRIHEAERIQQDPSSPSRVLLIHASSRSDQTCPGEMSKTYRLAQLARKAIEKEAGFEVDFLDLSNLTSEYGRVIYPCKACVSTSMPLCHWPCSCYPNHAIGQVGDWMNEIYPRWVSAHGVMILCPVNWYQAPSVLKLMIDRLVCADGGNPDPTTTKGKTPELAKEIELKGWDYPKHLAGRAFAVVVHGDAAGVESLGRILVDWLTDMELIPASPSPGLARYVGYFAPYATSHQDLDRDRDFQIEVQNQALTLVEMIRQIRSGKYVRPDENFESPRQK
jgi:multimeric flavodoxin WrbA